MNYDQSWMTEKKTQQKKMKINGMASIPVQVLNCYSLNFSFHSHSPFSLAQKDKEYFKELLIKNIVVQDKLYFFCIHPSYLKRKKLLE